MEKKTIKDEFKYCEYVDATFITLKDALQKCISHLTAEISAMTVFGSDFQKSVNLLNYLNSNYQGVSSFLEDYQKIEQTL